jgi:hypothetical protein
MQSEMHVNGPVKCESYNSTQLSKSYENFCRKLYAKLHINSTSSLEIQKKKGITSYLAQNWVIEQNNSVYCASSSIETRKKRGITSYLVQNWVIGQNNTAYCASLINHATF